MKQTVIIGAGLSGLAAAVTLAKEQFPCVLISVLPSERAQSVLAEGGINAALDNMGEDDSPLLHAEDTMKAGCDLADPEAVRGLTEHAPEIVRWLEALGVPFNREKGKLLQRSFGGQRKRRTVFARSSTGKIVMSALIDEVRKYEAAGLVTRYPHHEFNELILKDGACVGVEVTDTRTGETLTFGGEVLLCCGGLNGFFPGMTTGTTANTGAAAARVFAQGVRFGNLEMIQYHPTTFGISGKRCLISEAARGEGGRLYTLRNGEKWHFMEEKYPERGNLMPRDVVSREMYFVAHDPACCGQVYLDMTELSSAVWAKRLPDLRAEILHYMGKDPKKQPIPVDPGIHYFMGGIEVDIHHRTSIPGLHASGECCCQYHGANRLGANSMLGAMYGGRTAAQDILSCGLRDLPEHPEGSGQAAEAASPVLIRQMGDILYEALGIVREEDGLQSGLARLRAMKPENRAERERLQLAEAMILSALARKESRGAHYRTDYPERDPAQQRETRAWMTGGEVYAAL